MLRELITINPRHSPKSNPRGKRKAHRARLTRRNPRFVPKAFQGIVQPLVPALVGGGGALGIDLLLAWLLKQLPEGNLKASLSSGWLRAAARGGLAFGMGYGARMLGLKAQLADQATAGALTVVAYDELKRLLVAQFPEALAAYRYEGDLAAYERVAGPGYDALPALRRMGAGSAAGTASDVLNGLQPVVR